MFRRIHGSQRMVDVQNTDVFSSQVAHNAHPQRFRTQVEIASIYAIEIKKRARKNRAVGIRDSWDVTKHVEMKVSESEMMFVKCRVVVRRVRYGVEGD